MMRTYSKAAALLALGFTGGHAPALAQECHDAKAYVTVTSHRQTNYMYCKVNNHTPYGLTAGIKNNGSHAVTVNTCAVDARGRIIACSSNDLNPGQSLGGWATDLVWCGTEPQSVEYKASLSGDPDRCTKM